MVKTEVELSGSGWLELWRVKHGVVEGGGTGKVEKLGWGRSWALGGGLRLEYWVLDFGFGSKIWVSMVGRGIDYYFNVSRLVGASLVTGSDFSQFNR